MTLASRTVKNPPGLAASEIAATTLEQRLAESGAFWRPIIEQVQETARRAHALTDTYEHSRWWAR